MDGAPGQQRSLHRTVFFDEAKCFIHGLLETDFGSLDLCQQTGFIEMIFAPTTHRFQDYFRLINNEGWPAGNNFQLVVGDDSGNLNYNSLVDIQIGELQVDPD